MAKILTFCDFYLPGFKAGGPITTIRNLTLRLGGDLRFGIVTRDRDLGDSEPYPCRPRGEWMRIENADVFYLASGGFNRAACEQLLRDERPDLIYINSFHSLSFALAPLIARRRVEPDLPLVLAPRGEFAPAALELKSLKKRFYRRFVKAFHLLDGAVFQASSENEAADIRSALGISNPILVAPDMTAPLAPPPARRAEKIAGSARLVFLGRISPMKNLNWLIEVLSPLERVSLEVYGPVEDEGYWADCLRLAHSSSASITVRGALLPTEVASVLSDADALVLPSRGENFGQVVPEALAAGCPVLVSDRTPWSEVTERGSGWYLPLEIRVWRDAIEELAVMNEMRHARMRAAARAMAELMDADKTVLEANRRLFVTTHEA